MNLSKTFLCFLIALTVTPFPVFCQTEPFTGGLKGPENLAFDGKGNLYVSDTNHLWRIRLSDASGGYAPLKELYARDPVTDGISLGGVSLGPGGKIYFSAGNRILVLDPGDYSISEMAAGFAFANGNCFDDRGNLFIADSDTKVLYVVPAGENQAKVLAEKPGWVNGLVWSRSDNILYATISAPGRLAGYALSEDGLSVKEEISVTKFPFGGLDDLTMDDAGNFYVCMWLNGKIMKVNSKGKKKVFIDNVDGPSALAFGLGEDTDTLYICVKGGNTNFEGTEVVTMKAGAKGYRLPFLP